MANGAGRIFDVIKNTSEGTNVLPSEVVHLKVKSLSPLVFTKDDKLEISRDFCIFNKSFSLNSTEVGDVITAFVFNEGQAYFIQQNETHGGSGGGGGTTDYNDLDNKPKINNVTLYGNKTGNDLGLVNKETGKGLSTNDYTTEYKNKLDNIEANAQVNKIESISVNGIQQTITNKNIDLTISGRWNRRNCI